jgi:hypothetical protein
MQFRASSGTATRSGRRAGHNEPDEEIAEPLAPMLRAVLPDSPHKTPDRNAAAEMAFVACASEEQDLASFVNLRIPPAYSPLPHLKAETKRVLIGEGHLPIYPER